MQYTVIFIFDEKLENVLLAKKNRGPYPNCLNGVGGKLDERDEDCIRGGLRELKEETGITRDMLSAYALLCKMIYPSGVELFVFYGVIRNGCSYQQLEDEPLSWYPVAFTRDVASPRFAGEGNLSYFVNASLINLRMEESGHPMS